MYLTFRKMENPRISQSVASRMDFCCQLSLGSAYTLFFLSLPTAPAECGCALVIVASIAAYSPSASTDNKSKILFHISFDHQRRYRFMDITEVTVNFGNVPPRTACSVTPNHGIHEKPRIR